MRIAPGLGFQKINGRSLDDRCPRAVVVRNNAHQTGIKPKSFQVDDVDVLFTQPSDQAAILTNKFSDQPGILKPVS